MKKILILLGLIVCLSFTGCGSKCKGNLEKDLTFMGMEMQIANYLLREAKSAVSDEKRDKQGKEAEYHYKEEIRLIEHILKKHPNELKLESVYLEENLKNFRDIAKKNIDLINKKQIENVKDEDIVF